MFCPYFALSKIPHLWKTTLHGRTSLDGFDVPVTPHVYSRLYHVIGCPWSLDESLNQLPPSSRGLATPLRDVAKERGGLCGQEAMGYGKDNALY